MAEGRGAKPGERRGGRGKGTPSTLPDLRAMGIKALLQAGGVDYLASQARENPGPFLGFLGRILPREVHTELTAEVVHRNEVRRDLIDKLCVMLVTQATERIEHTTPPPPLPAIAHIPDAMLKAQSTQARERLSRRQEHAREDGYAVVAGAVQRGAAMHLERSRSMESGKPEASSETVIDRAEGSGYPAPARIVGMA